MIFNLFGLSPYTLLVDINIKVEFGEYFFVNSKIAKVELALIAKSTDGKFLAQS